MRVATGEKTETLTHDGDDAGRRGRIRADRFEQRSGAARSAAQAGWRRNAD